MTGIKRSQYESVYYRTAQKALVWLSLFHLLVITSSNYLVQLPISIFGFHTTRGAFSFPFIFLATDLTVRILAPAGATHHFRGDGPGAGHLLRHLRAVLHGRMAGLLPRWEPLISSSRASPSPALWPMRWGRSSTFTSLTACGRAAAGGWPLPPRRCSATSAIPWRFSLSLSGAARTRLWPPTGEIALVDYSFKVLISIIFFLPMYGVLLNMLLKRLADKSDLSALQPS